MQTTTRQDRFIAVGKDGGTGKHKYSDAISAYKSVSAEDKRRAFIMLGAAGGTVAFMLLSRLLWLLKPLYDLADYGMLSEIIYYIVLGIVCTVFIITLNAVIKNTCDVKLFRRRARTVNIPRALGVIAIAAATVFIVSATFGFQLKLQKEMGMGVSISTAFTNISVYLYYGLHMWLGFTAAALVQYALSMLFPAKHTVPWGAIFLVTVYGLLEFIFEYTTTDHLFSAYYYFMTYAYAAIYILTGRSFHVSFWASIAVMIL